MGGFHWGYHLPLWGVGFIGFTIYPYRLGFIWDTSSLMGVSFIGGTINTLGLGFQIVLNIRKFRITNNLAFIKLI
jgi:hypothetical protein